MFCLCTDECSKGCSGPTLKTLQRFGTLGRRSNGPHPVSSSSGTADRKAKQAKSVLHATLLYLKSCSQYRLSNNADWRQAAARLHQSQAKAVCITEHALLYPESINISLMLAKDATTISSVAQASDTCCIQARNKPLQACLQSMQSGNLCLKQCVPACPAVSV